MFVNYPKITHDVLEPEEEISFGVDVIIVSDKGNYLDKYYGYIPGGYQYKSPISGKLINKSERINIDVRIEPETCSGNNGYYSASWGGGGSGIGWGGGGFSISYPSHKDDDLGYTWLDFTYAPNAQDLSEVPDLPVLPSAGGWKEVRAKLRILQEATLERQAFNAFLLITNLWADKIMNLSANLSIRDMQNNETDKFFVKPSITGIESINGNSSLAANSSADINWFILPEIGAAGSNSEIYNLSATISGHIEGEGNFSFDTDDEQITVKPMPLLNLLYLLPDKVKAEVPFKLAVFVENVGYGKAKNLKIETIKAEIVEDHSGLISGFIKITSEYLGKNILLVNLLI